MHMGQWHAINVSLVMSFLRAVMKKKMDGGSNENVSGR